MFFTKSLRLKAIIAALVPTVLVLVVVAVIGLYVYERLTRNIVEERDTELAMITAARLSEGLTVHRQILQNLVADDDIQSMEQARLRTALEKAQLQLFVFDSVLVYDHQGVAVSSDPFAFERRGTDFPVPSEFEKVRSTLQPHFSDVFKDSHSGQDAILLAVPVVASGAEFKGVVVGISTLSSLLSDAMYSAVLEITAGGGGFAYLVDGNGRVIYHRDSSQLGSDLSAITPVIRLRQRGADAVITKDPSGEKVISGFAPVPGTSWGVITQEEWSNVVGPIQTYGKLLVALLALGGVLSAGFIFFAIGRVLKPIKDLTQGAQRIAGGDFAHSISARTGDEIQSLAEQFNTMAGALKESYADLEQKVEARTDDLARSNADLQQFAYVASHDLQEPLRMVSSYTQLLARRYQGRLDADADEFIGYAVDGALRMQDLINDLLAFSRIGTNGNPVEMADVNAVFEGVVAGLRLTIENNDAAVTRDPLPTVRADASELVQILQNLIVNAIKFHGDDSPRVHVSAQRSGDEWLFSVRDNGIGIEPEYGDRIFGVFQRLHTRDKYPGTGIGLAICKKVVERHAGRIWVESEAGKGSVFYFTLPAGG